MKSAIRPAVSTGVASRISTAVTSTVQTKIGIRNSVIPGARILKIVVMKFTAPRIEAVPTRVSPMIHRSVPGLSCPDRERRVGRPALGGGSAEDVAAEDQQPAERQEPEAEGVDPREGHVRRAELERHDVVREARQGRDDEQEQHDRPVHRERLVERVLVDELEARHGQLAADHEGEEPGGEEEEEAVDDVEDPDLLVVDGRQPVEHPRPPIGGGAGLGFEGRGRHRSCSGSSGYGEIVRSPVIACG